MPASEANSADLVEWARQVNRRWIVHHGLQESANAYLDHLAETDPERLIRSCERARTLVKQYPPGDDPKPWFYAGLFSLATPDEAGQYLQGHWFTSNCIPSIAEVLHTGSASNPVKSETQSKLERIRAAIDQLQRES